MNDFAEYIVEKRRTLGDVIKTAVAVVLAFILVAAAVMSRLNSTLVTLIVVGIIYAAYKIASSSNVEYEYILTGNDMDVDKIVNKKSRKRIVSINIRRVDEFEKCDGRRENRFLNDGSIKVYDACRDRGEGCFFMTFSDEMGKAVLLFTPNENVEEYIRKILKGRF